VLAIFGLWAIALASGFLIDWQLAMIVILVVGGIALIATALIASLRRPKS
jgi:hypothetical protein